MEQEWEAYSEPCQASKMEPSVKIFSQKATQSFTIFAKNFILDIWQGSEYTSEPEYYHQTSGNVWEKIELCPTKAASQRHSCPAWS